MPDRIIIDQGVARLETYTTQGEIPVGELEGIIKHTTPITLPILPKGTVSAHFNPNASPSTARILVRRNPARHKLNLHYDGTGHTPIEDRNREYRVFDIQLPHLYWLYDVRYDVKSAFKGTNAFAIAESYLFMSPDPVTSPDSKLYPAQLWNIRSSRICWGQTLPRQMSMVEAIDGLTDEFPTTTFTPHYGHPVPPPYASYAEWETDSNNPTCYRNWDWANWPERAYPVSQYLNQDLNTTVTIDMNLPAEVDIEPPPPVFTNARLRQWLATLPEHSRERFVLTAQNYRAETPGVPDGAPLQPNQRVVEVPGVGTIVVTETAE